MFSYNGSLKSGVYMLIIISSWCGKSNFTILNID